MSFPRMSPYAKAERYRKRCMKLIAKTEKALQKELDRYRAVQQARFR